jgi:hypothetical protein
MRVLVDPESGELVEHLPTDLAATDPYDYAEAKRAVMAATRETREVLRQLDAAIVEKADAEKDYLVRKARAMEVAKREHGATVAEDVAKGEPAVAEAYARRDRSRERVRALQARARLCSEDRASLHRLIEWSREADPDGWRASS